MLDKMEKNGAQASERASEQASAQTSEQGEELVSIRLPLTREQQGDVFVRVNQRTWLIQRGETVQVPACVLEVLEHAEQAQRAGLLFQDSFWVKRSVHASPSNDAWTRSVEMFAAFAYQ